MSRSSVLLKPTLKEENVATFVEKLHYAVTVIVFPALRRAVLRKIRVQVEGGLFTYSIEYLHNLQFILVWTIWPS